MCLSIIMEGLQAVLSGQFPIISKWTISSLTEVQTSNLDWTQHFSVLTPYNIEENKEKGKQ
jgi:hypothetical protein